MCCRNRLAGGRRRPKVHGCLVVLLQHYWLLLRVIYSLTGVNFVQVTDQDSRTGSPEEISSGNWQANNNSSPIAVVMESCGVKHWNYRNRTLKRDAVNLVSIIEFGGNTSWSLSDQTTIHIYLYYWDGRGRINIYEELICVA